MIRIGIGIGEMRTIDIRIVKKRSFQCCHTKICSTKISKIKSCSSEIGSAQMCSA